MGSKRVLITGGLGFIGTQLMRRLSAQGYRLRAMDNLSAQIHGVIPAFNSELLAGIDLELVRGDVRNRMELAASLEGVDLIIHLAAETGTAQSMYEIARYNAVNSQGTAELLDCLLNQPHQVKKVVLASSRSIYGEGAYHCETCGAVCPDSRTDAAMARGEWEPACPSCRDAIRPVATPESSAPHPASIYAATKLAQEDLIRIACGSAGIPFSILRFQNVFGPGQSLNNPYTGILSIFSTRIRRGLDLPIFEDGRESRDFIHVADIAKAIALCLEQPATDGLTLNVGSGKAVSVQAVAEMLIAAFRGNSRTEVTGQYRLGDIRHCFADISRIEAATGFAPEVSLEAGLAEFARWVTSQPLPEDGLDKANQTLKQKGLMK